MLVIVVVVLAGCVGIGASIPSTKTSVAQVSHIVDYADEEYLPREKKRRETVSRNLQNNEIVFTNDGRECYHHLLVVPLPMGECKGFESWNYSDDGKVLITKRSYKLYGFWCSPIPYISWVPSLAVSVNPSTIFPFCDFHWGTVLHEVFHF